MLSLPSPRSLGFDRFISYRQQQIKAVYDLTGSTRRNRIVNAPTGIGKTLIATTVATLESARALFVTSTKALQDQYVRDAASAGMVDIRGSSNYPCPALERGGEFAHLRGSGGATADRGPCLSGMSCRLKAGGCPKYDALRTATGSQMVTTNYDYWLSNRPGENAEEIIGDFDYIFFDELHAAFDHVARTLRIELPVGIVRRYLEQDPPPGDLTTDEWRRWATAMQLRTASTLDTITAELRYARERGVVEREMIDEMGEVRALDRALLSMAGMWGRWVTERVAGAVVFDPVWVDRDVERLLFRGIPVVVGLSATVRPSAMQYLGVPADAFDFFEYDSPFDPRRGPIWRWPLVRMHWKMGDGEKRVWARGIDQLVDDRMDRRSIVQTNSYKQAREYVQMSHHQSSIIAHDPRSLRQAVERYRIAKPPVALVSPSVGTGWDFAYDACELNVIAKVPYPPMESPVMRARMESDKKYGTRYAKQEIEQRAGRHVRADDDQGETVIVDSAFGGLMGGNGYLDFSKSFLRRLKYTTGPPRPLPKLKLTVPHG